MMECQETFDKVKHALTYVSMFSLPTIIEPFEVICSASIVGIGVIFSEKNDQ